MRKVFLLIVALFSSISVSFADEKFSVAHENEYGGIIINCTIQDFNALGYEYGDSLNFNFSKRIIYFLLA